MSKDNAFEYIIIKEKTLPQVLALTFCLSHSSLFMAECVQCAHKLTCVQLFLHLSGAVFPACPAALPKHIRHRANYPSEQNNYDFLKIHQQVCLET